MEAQKEADDWRSELEKEAESSLQAEDLRRAAEPGRGREAETPEQIPPRGWRDIAIRLFWAIPDDRILATAGSVAFFALLAIFPALATVVSLYGLVADATTIGGHLALLSGILPRGVLDILRDQIALITSKSNNTLGLAFLLGLGIAFWSANSGMVALFDALNVVYGEKEKRSLLRLYGTSFLFTLGAVGFVIAALLAVVALPIIFNFVGLSTWTERAINIGRWPLMLVTVTLALSAIYRFGPSRRDARWRWVTWGSLFGAVLWVGASMLFSWYVAVFDSYNRVYGSLGAGIGFMTWIWISFVTVLLGAELNAEMEHQTARDTTEGPPKPLGKRGAIVADHVGAAQA